ncbi:MAG: branched-chain amino acid ABC transporter permease [Bacillota bacterium]
MILEQVINGLSLGSVYGLIALGYSLVYGMMEILNFAHGDIFMVGAMVGWVISTRLIGSIPASLVLVLSLVGAAVASGLIGWATERFAYRPLQKGSRLAPLLTALGVSILLQNVVLLTLGARSRVYPSQALLSGWPTITIAGAVLSPSRQMMMICALALLVALDYFAQHTTLGTALRAVAQDRQAAALMGIDVQRIISLVFIIGSSLAGIAGVLVGLYYGQADFYMGYTAGMKAFTAAVLGGIGQMRGAALGGLLLGLVESLSVLVLPPIYRDMITFAVLIVILLVRPNGLLGRAADSRA